LPEWSADGGRLSFGIPNNGFLPLGLSDIYTINGRCTGVSQITDLPIFRTVSGSEPSGRPRQRPRRRGHHQRHEWPLENSADGGCQHCDCPAHLLPTAPGDRIDFAGSIVVAPTAPVAMPGLFIRLDPNTAVVYWSTNYQGFGLEYTTNLAASASWTAIAGPYFLNAATLNITRPKLRCSPQNISG